MKSTGQLGIRVDDDKNGKDVGYDFAIHDVGDTTNPMHLVIATFSNLVFVRAVGVVHYVSVMCFKKKKRGKKPKANK